MKKMFLQSTNSEKKNEIWLDADGSNITCARLLQFYYWICWNSHDFVDCTLHWIEIGMSAFVIINHSFRKPVVIFDDHVHYLIIIWNWLTSVNFEFTSCMFVDWYVMWLKHIACSFAIGLHRLKYTNYYSDLRQWIWSNSGSYVSFGVLIKNW